MRGRPRLGDLLVEAGEVARAVVEEAAAERAGPGRRLGERLIARAATSERAVYRALAQQRGLPFARADELLVGADPALLGAVPRAFLAHNPVVPVARIGDAVAVATSEPDADLTPLVSVFDAELDVRVVTPTDLARLRRALELGQVELPVAAVAPPVPRADLASADGLDPEAVALTEAILLDAIAERASDVHLEQYEGAVRVRLRVDGDLRDVRHFHLTRAQHRAIVNVLKIRGELDIAERRVPQGGRSTATAGGQTFDLRIQTQPALHGENVVVRLLPQQLRPLALEELGFLPDQARAYRRLLDSPGGLVLVVGPTGSGKSTTLYAGLQILARDATRKVITVEEPIEYALDGIQQTQVRPEVGFHFASAMRAFVRQDPDVILVGEIRDPETALEAIRASQTGHLVLSTLHCNDAVDAVQRLIDLGMHPNSVASELIAVFAQRLGKRLCEACRVEASPAAALLEEIFPAGVPAGRRFFRGAGCARCGGVGTLGRVAVAEHLPASPVLRNAIAHRMPIDELRQVALGSGLVPLREAALALVDQGLIALDELPQMLPPERLRPERAG